MEDCSDLIENLLHEKPKFYATEFSVSWNLSDDKKAKEQLNRLYSIAEQAIEWI